MSTVMVSGDTTGEASAQEFESLFREHYQLVYRTAYSVTGRTEDAEDIVQTVFLKLLRRESPLDLGNPNGYLYRAALNLALDTIRRRQRHVLAFDDKYFERPAKGSDAHDVEDLNRAISGEKFGSNLFNELSPDVLALLK